MADNQVKIEADRQLLRDAQSKGPRATLGACVRLSGPGWLQSAITLGGGSLAGALFLGALGGVSMLWLQLVAIIMGVVMLSAISYVTLSTGERPFHAINVHINPVLGWGWLIATSLANMIWCMPQFSLCYAGLEKNLLPETIGSTKTWQFGVSIAILVAVICVVVLNAHRGVAAKIFDLLLKGLVGLVVVCFVGVVVLLSTKGIVDWGQILLGFIPDLSQWTSPTGKVAELLQGMSVEDQEFWSGRVVKQQRARMIAAAATAVGINMTFLMPYSMLHRGWDKPFRGLARFDLMTGMAIPYILVTSCVVIASAHAFNGKADDQLLSTEPATFVQSPTFGGVKDVLFARVAPDSEFKKYDAAVKDMSDAEVGALLEKMAALPDDEKRIAASMVQRNAAALSQTLAPLLGEGETGKRRANLIFGLGVFGMGFSTIIILMLINGFVFCEAVGKPDSTVPYVAGCLVAGIVGAMWPAFWEGDSKVWLAILASSFGMMLLPIAYVTFFMMMNSKSLMGDEKPRGASMAIWNVLMIISVAGAIIAAGTAIYDKASHPTAGPLVIIMGGVFVVLAVIGFFLKKKPGSEGS